MNVGKLSSLRMCSQGHTCQGFFSNLQNVRTYVFIYCSTAIWRLTVIILYWQSVLGNVLHYLLIICRGDLWHSSNIQYAPILSVHTAVTYSTGQYINWVVLQFTFNQKTYTEAYWIYIDSMTARCSAQFTKNTIESLSILYK